MLYLILGLVVLGLVAAIASRFFHASKRDENEPERIIPAGCCGQHATCERDSLLAGVSPTIVYYDDEELDAFKGREPESYSDEETEAFEEVLQSMQQADVPGWMRSLSLRQIELPTQLREEVLLLVNDLRERRDVDKHSV